MKLTNNRVIFHPCPYISEQNGIVERKHRHVVRTGITLLAQAEMPFIYSTEAFLIDVDLINRLPTPVLDYTFPFEALYHICYPYLRP